MKVLGPQHDWSCAGQTGLCLKARRKQQIGGSYAKGIRKWVSGHGAWKNVSRNARALLGPRSIVCR